MFSLLISKPYYRHDPTDSPTLPYAPGDLTKRAMIDVTGKTPRAPTDSGTVAAVGANESEEELDLSVLKELEECLAMEKELLIKLNNIRSSATS